MAVRLRRVTASVGAMQTNFNTEEGPNTIQDSFVEECLARGPGSMMKSELEWGHQVQALQQALEKAARGCMQPESGVVCRPRCLTR